MKNNRTEHEKRTESRRNEKKRKDRREIYVTFIIVVAGLTMKYNTI